MGTLRPYIVRQRDHLDRIAFEVGVDRDVIWSHAANADLRARRPDPNQLAPGDVVQVPDKASSARSLTLGDANAYHAEVPAIPLVLRLDSLARGRALPCVVEGALAPTPDEIAADGTLSLRASLLAGAVTVTIPSLDLRLEVQLGGLDPVEESTGLAHRLANLGYAPPDGDDPAATTRLALRRFQRDQGLPETGVADEETTARLRDRFGC